MIDLVPRRAFMRFEFPIRRMAETPALDGRPGKWTPEYRLPALVEIEDTPAFADVYAAWNERHLLVAFDVPNRRGRLVCDPKQWWKGDGLRVCVNTRDTPDIRRGTRFCHFFYFLPTGGGTNRRQPIVGTHRLSRAKDAPPAADLSQVRVGVRIERSGYFLEAAIPAGCLHGWDPAEHPRIGFFYKISDTHFGEQHLTVDDELGWNADPSTWATAVLVA